MSFLQKILSKADLTDYQKEGCIASKKQLQAESPKPRPNSEQKARKWLEGYGKKKK